MKSQPFDRVADCNPIEQPKDFSCGAINQLTQRARDILDTQHKAISRLSSIRDKLFGESPETTSDPSGPGQTVSGELAELRVVLDQIESAAYESHCIIDQLKEV